MHIFAKNNLKTLKSRIFLFLTNSVFRAPILRNFVFKPKLCVLDIDFLFTFFSGGKAENLRGKALFPIQILSI